MHDDSLCSGPTALTSEDMLFHMLVSRVDRPTVQAYDYRLLNRGMPNVVVDGVVVHRLIDGVVVHPRMLVGGFGGAAAVRAAGGLG